MIRKHKAEIHTCLQNIHIKEYHSMGRPKKILEQERERKIFYSFSFPFFQPAKSTHTLNKEEEGGGGGGGGENIFTKEGVLFT